MAVVIETTLGDITVDLFIEERPRACLNFVKLCKLKYYNFNLFHTIERDFIAQTGDPKGVGDGGESVWGVVEGTHKRFFEAESLPKIKHTVPGLLSLVSVGKFMVGSQFFLTLGSDLTSLDGIHCVIGEVVEGHEVLRKLNEAIVDEKFRPYQDIRVTHTVILDDPFNDPRGFQIPSRSPSPSAERLQNGRIGADEDIDDTEGKTVEEIHEMLAEREAKARATILEIVGDLPDADIAPPENVLFVCKLNPVTTDDDLEIIFSRFGKVKSCEVIRDKVTGDSLQYAFVEFEEQKACEAAYFKMDNVLIDDRRIHVDFSQSVSKVQWRGKGRLIHKEENDKKLDFNNLRGEEKHGQYQRSEQRRQRDRSRSPMRRKPDGDRKDPSLHNRPPREFASSRDIGNSNRYYSPDTRRESPVKERRRSPLNERRRSRSNDRRPYQNRNQAYGDWRHYNDRRRSFPPNSNNRVEERRRFYDMNERHVNRDSYRNSRQDTRHNRNYNSREERSEQLSPSPRGTKDRVQSDHRLKKVDKRSKSKKHDKNKNRKHVSSSSSESESDSSSTSTSTSSSSSSDEKRKKSSKSKRKPEKTKTRQKKKSKRRDSTSSE